MPQIQDARPLPNSHINIRRNTRGGNSLSGCTRRQLLSRMHRGRMLTSIHVHHPFALSPTRPHARTQTTCRWQGARARGLSTSESFRLRPSPSLPSPSSLESLPPSPDLLPGKMTVQIMPAHASANDLGAHKYFWFTLPDGLLTATCTGKARHPPSACLSQF